MSAEERCVSRCRDVDSNGLPFTLTKCDVCRRDDIATARAEGETAGYAKGRREAFCEAADYLVEVARILGSNGEVDELGMASIRAAHATAIETCAAALRAKADAEAPHE